MALSELQGVEGVRVDLARDLFTVSYSETETSAAEMFHAIESLGYKPSLDVSEFRSAPSTKLEELPMDIASLLDGDSPVSIYFGAKWCGACKIMERTTFADESVKAKLEEFAFRKVDIEENPDATEAFSIRGVPTLIILGSSGEELYRYVGPLSPSEALLVLEQFDEH